MKLAFSTAVPKTSLGKNLYITADSLVNKLLSLQIWPLLSAEERIKIKLLDYSYMIINQNSHSKNSILKHRWNMSKYTDAWFNEYLVGGKTRKYIIYKMIP